MKNIKMALTALAVFAVVGGALAFKTKKFSTHFCASQTQNSGCTVVLKTLGSGTANYYIDPNYTNGGTCNSAVCGSFVDLEID
jgi:hypothetical protein